MQDLPAPGRIFGVVDINTNRERLVARKADRNASPDEWLQIQPGRDRLHDNRAFHQLRDLVRLSLDLYANRHRLRALQAVDRQRDQEPPSRKYDRVVKVLHDNRTEIPASAMRQIERELVDARNAALLEERSLDRRAALLAPLATAGMMALALTHELSREVQFLKLTGGQLRRFARSHSMPDLADIAGRFDDAQRRLDSLRRLFAPLLSNVDLEATERLSVRVVVKQSVEAMRILMPRVGFDLSGIPTDLRFPVGSLVDWNAILQNVLANAWNAMLDSHQARVAFTGGRGVRNSEWLRVSDTGQGLGVPLDEAAQLFEPFERRLVIDDDKRSIAIGGQGLGLAIVRMIAARRSATVGFIEPEKSFSTTFVISWKGASQ
jgi:signal transduction histidine kinase